MSIPGYSDDMDDFEDLMWGQFDQLPVQGQLKQQKQQQKLPVEHQEDKKVVDNP